MLKVYEWLAGYAHRYGVAWVDYDSLEHIPKLSAAYFREVATHNRVL